MTRREWSEIAAVIREEREEWRQPYSEAINAVAVRVATVLAAHHSRFDVKRFLAECGVQGCMTFRLRPG